ncbi:unnamed protein product, partial [Mesorhabditis belari]|uniref:Uncharacterized protein n=1 Tax=Mesorhabditis belari TaxID=2138241 RepID=A0AAF3EKK9_9BILA
MIKILFLSKSLKQFLSDLNWKFLQFKLSRKCDVSLHSNDWFIVCLVTVNISVRDFRVHASLHVDVTTEAPTTGTTTVQEVFFDNND